MRSHRNLVIASNRLPLQGTAQAGGLAVALAAVANQSACRWFGGNASGCFSARDAWAAPNGGEYLPVELGPGRDTELHGQYVNGALWPILHSRPDLMRFDEACWEAFLRVNATFAQRLISQLSSSDLLWVQDYHLIPLAESLQAKGMTARSGFFLHVPFPPHQTMTKLPRHAELLAQLASFDLVGVQTPQDLRRFVGYMVDAHGATIAGLQGSAGKDLVEIQMPDGRSFRAAPYPISIDTRVVEACAPAATNNPSVARLAASLGDSSLILGVDRLDYAKGLEERFDAYRRFLESDAARVDECTFVQIAPLSRAEIMEYRQLRDRLDRQVGRINGAFCRPDRTPLRYVNRSYPQRTLYGFYRLAKVGLVTPLCDGMNLVAKEFIASQDPVDPGVLVLSRFAGAANELCDALIVDPYDTDEVRLAIETALAMPLAERQSRWSTMMEHLRRRDVHAWAEDFLADLDAGLGRSAVPGAPSRAHASSASVAAR